MIPLRSLPFALSFTLGLLLPGLLRGAEPAEPAANRVRIILVGDSTMAVNSGYGPGLCALADPATTDCVNMAKGGRSSGSYRAEGSWDRVMATLRNGRCYQATYVLIQFGHNDQPGKPGRSTDLRTEFPANLRRYVRNVRSAGARPILVTPLTRRTFRHGQLADDLAPWADATRQVGREEGVPVLELNAESAAAVRKMGPVEANTLAMSPPSPAIAAAAAARIFDYTHLGPKGAAYFGRLVATELCRAEPELRLHFRQCP